MNLDKFTHKAQEAITNCRTILSRFGQSQVTPEIVLLAILEQEEGVASKIMERLDANPAVVIEEVSQYLQTQPKGSAVSMSKDEIHRCV